MPMAVARSGGGEVTCEAAGYQGSSRSAKVEVAVVRRRREDRAEEWHHDEHRHAAAVQALKDEASASREAACAAQNRQSQIANAADEHASLVKANNLESDCDRARELQRLREQLLEEMELAEEARASGDRELADVEQEITSEQQKRATIEQLIAAEKLPRDELRRRADEVLENELRLLKAQEERRRNARVDATRRAEKAGRTAEERVRARIRQLGEDVAALEKQRARVAEDGAAAANAEVSRRNGAQKSFVDAVQEIDKQVSHSLHSTRVEMHRLQEDMLQQIGVAQISEFSREKVLQERISDVLAATGCALEERRHAAMFEDANQRRIEAATVSLGSSFARSAQFNFLMK